MALANELRHAGYCPEQIDATATVTMELIAAGWTMTGIHLDVVAWVPRAPQCDFIDAAVRANPNGADAHFMIANALGRLSLTRGGKERVRFARIIYDEAMKAVKLDSTHDGAYHVLGSWNAEIKRLSGIQRFFAKALFGAGFMDKANWPDAQRYLKQAVAWKPGNIFHRLELAEVYMDVGRSSAAREQLTAIAGLPLADVLDHEYKEDAVLDLKDIAGRKDKT